VGLIHILPCFQGGDLPFASDQGEGEAWALQEGCTRSYLEPG